MTKSQRKSSNSESQEAKKTPGQGIVDPTDWAVLSNLRHELGTHLNAIIGYSEMLLEDAGKQGQGNFIPDLQKINAAGKRILGLIDKIVKHAKIQSDVMDTGIQNLASSSATSPLIQDVLGTSCPSAEDPASTKPNEHGFLLVWAK